MAFFSLSWLCTVYCLNSLLSCSDIWWKSCNPAWPIGCRHVPQSMDIRPTWAATPIAVWIVVWAPVNTRVRWQDYPSPLQCFFFYLHKAFLVRKHRLHLSFARQDQAETREHREGLGCEHCFAQNLAFICGVPFCVCRLLLVPTSAILYPLQGYHLQCVHTVKINLYFFVIFQCLYLWYDLIYADSNRLFLAQTLCHLIFQCSNNKNE